MPILEPPIVLLLNSTSKSKLSKSVQVQGTGALVSEVISNQFDHSPESPSPEL